jgi:uncharacterized Zn finger protein (UPF0148 family)
MKSELPLIDTCSRCKSTAFRGPRPSENGGDVICAQCGAHHDGHQAPPDPRSNWEIQMEEDEREASDRGWDHYDD